MIPDLPEPHRFFSTMSLIGATGSLAFDTDHALADQPRRNASVVAGPLHRIRLISEITRRQGISSRAAMVR